MKAIFNSLLLASIVSLTKAQWDNPLWDKAFIDEIAGGQVKNCFKDLNHPDKEFFLTRDDPDMDYDDVITIDIRDGYFCVFDAERPFAITRETEVNEYGLGLLGYYFPYKGYGPAYMAGEGTCEFQPLY